ncbi:MAG: helix-turn-helix domain-containing protein [Oscillospiraceae bacterium]|nr:helix-turn-helix domain-containing protein [Oscillospiraceae bacterium]
MKKTYTVKEIQEILQISKPTAYALIKSGVFSSIKFKNTLRISKESFDRWLDSDLSNMRSEESHYFLSPDERVLLEKNDAKGKLTNGKNT